MASSPTSPTETAPETGSGTSPEAQPRSAGKFRHQPLRFEARLRLYSAVLCLPILGLLAALLLIEHLSARASAGILILAALLLLFIVTIFIDRIIRPLQTLANVVAALREEDYSFRARGARANDPFGDLAMEINALADMRQAQRLGSLDAAALFRRVIAELDTPVLALDRSNCLRLINPAAERLFKLNAARDLGRTAADLHLEMLTGHNGESVVQIDDKLSRAPSRWMVHASQFRQHGAPHTLLLLSDVSTALREEERVAWQRLIRVLGHEISNSLTPIKSIAGTLRSRLPQTQAGAQHCIGNQTVDPAGVEALDGFFSNLDFSDFDRGLQIIESRAESLNRFVQSYRQLAQLPAPSLRRVAVRPLLERVVSLEQRITVELKSVPDCEISADPDQIEQLLINLIRNGVEAAWRAPEDAADGPSTPPTVSVQALLQAGSVTLTVTDNGPGAANPGNLFVPFYTTKKSGSGVGLALARQIAEAHGGTLELRNRIDTHGCQAVVRLPLAGREV